VADLELEPRATDDGTVIAVRGEVDMASAPQLRDLLNHLVDHSTASIVLDCEHLDFLDSSGIGVLVATTKRLGDGRTITIDTPQPHVRKVLELTGVADHVTIRP
jgi:anti-sigma B factor antagonist